MFTSGKHNQKTFEYVLTHDLKYSLWMLQQPPTTEPIRKFQQFLCGKIFNQPLTSGNTTITKLSLQLNGHPAIIEPIVQGTSTINRTYNRRLHNPFAMSSPTETEILQKFTEIAFHYNISVMTGRIYDTEVCKGSTLSRIPRIYLEKIFASHEKLTRHCGDGNDVWNVAIGSVSSSVMGSELCEHLDAYKRRVEIMNHIVCYLEENISLKPVKNGLSLTHFPLSVIDDYTNWFINGEEWIEVVCSPFHVGEHLNDYIRAFIGASIAVSGNKKKRTTISSIKIINTYTGNEHSICIIDETLFAKLLGALQDLR
jgi:hypothetical protein